MTLFQFIKNLFSRPKVIKTVSKPVASKKPKIPVVVKTKKLNKTSISKTKDTYKEVFKKSPNQSGTIKPKYIILHDSEGSYVGGVSWITNSKSKVSYHYMIDSNGDRTQFVYDSKRAWHAGRSKWDNISGLNSCSIGIAFWGNTHKRELKFVEIDSCAHKCIYIMKKFNIPVDNILTHQMISPNRKTDTSPRAYKEVLKRITELLK